MEYFEKPGEFADQNSDLFSYKLDVSEESLYENEIEKKGKNNGSEICQTQIQTKNLKVIGNAELYNSQNDQQPTNAFTGASFLDTKQKEYTRHVTCIWAIFMFCLAVISFITVFLSNEIWVMFNGLISYILIAIMIGVEFIVRKRFINVRGNK